jgi:S-adenosylmethionine hydrolase
MPAAIITLLTDFGVNDTYVAQMKGVILGINPAATIVDITHAIEPQNVFHGALCLDEAFDAFPAGTIHVVVVDPGVGSARRRVGVEIGTQRFIGPDNGLLSLLAQRHTIQRVHKLTESRFHRLPVSATFHGRDVFAPVAAAWSLGEDLSSFGPAYTAPLIEIRQFPVMSRDGEIAGEIIAIDRFGNLISNISERDLPAEYSKIVTEVGGLQIQSLHRFYAEQPRGTVLALLSSSGRLEIARNGGSAAQLLGVSIGARVVVRWDTMAAMQNVESQ